MLSMLSIPRVELAVCKLNSDFAGGSKKMLKNQKISCLSKCMLSTQHVLIGVNKKKLTGFSKNHKYLKKEEN